MLNIEAFVLDIQWAYLTSDATEQAEMLAKNGVQQIVDAITPDFAHEVWFASIQGEQELEPSTEIAVFKLFLELTKGMMPAKFFLVYGGADLYDYLDTNKLSLQEWL